MRFPRIGPGALVAAAFIGPGTVTTCTLAGVRFGPTLLWALTFATIGTIILQEMAARLGTISGMGLGEAIRHRLHGGSKIAAGLLIASAIGLGNAAYQTGNLIGASLGAEVAFGGDLRLWAFVFAAVAGGLLWSGHYRVIERVLVGLVIVMALVFLVTAIGIGRDWPSLLEGALVPRLPAGSVVVALGLVGTTIVPYNLFLHASAARERFHGHAGGLTDARADLVVAIGLGGLVSMAIMVTAAASGRSDVGSAADMATQLAPLLGRWATVLFATGLLAAGLTSAITAPMAAAYALAGAFGWPADLQDRRLRMVWITIIAAGASFAAAGVRPLPAILFAQAANGLLLPLIAGFLLFVANDRKLLGKHANGRWTNLLGGAVVLLAVTLGLRAILGVL